MKRGEARKLKNQFDDKLKKLRHEQIALAKKYNEKKSAASIDLLRKKISSI